jgi:hypothetical protein
MVQALRVEDNRNGLVMQIRESRSEAIEPISPGAVNEPAEVGGLAGSVDRERIGNRVKTSFNTKQRRCQNARF